MSRTARWEFFITRWSQIYDWAATAVESAKRGPLAATLSRNEVARVDIALRKAQRAKELLTQLQDFDQQHALIVGRCKPLAATLPLASRDSAAAQEQQGLLQGQRALQGLSGGVSGSERQDGRPMATEQHGAQAPGMSAGETSAATAPDPFGICVALSPGQLLSVRTWRDHARQFELTAAAAAVLLDGPDLQQLRRFNWRRLHVLHEMQSLRQQLFADGVGIPPLQPLLDDARLLDELIDQLALLQAAQVDVLCDELAGLEVRLLELKLRTQQGAERFEGSEAQQALARLQVAQDVVTVLKQRATVAKGEARDDATESKRVGKVNRGAGSSKRTDRLPREAWEEVHADSAAVAASLQHMYGGRSTVDSNAQQYARQVYRRLSQIGQAVKIGT